MEKGLHPSLVGCSEPGSWLSSMHYAAGHRKIPSARCHAQPVSRKFPLYLAHPSGYSLKMEITLPHSTSGKSLVPVSSFFFVFLLVKHSKCSHSLIMALDALKISEENNILFEMCLFTSLGLLSLWRTRPWKFSLRLRNLCCCMGSSPLLSSSGSSQPDPRQASSKVICPRPP